MDLPRFVCSLILACFCVCPVLAADYHTYNTSTGDDFLWTRLDNLSPGDTLHVHAGWYSTRVHGYYYRTVKLYGTPSQPIVVNSIGSVTLSGSKEANVVDLHGRHFVWRGFEMVKGSIGLRLRDVKHAVIEECHVHDVQSVGIAANSNEMLYENITLRRNHVHHTRGHGECFYLGCNHGYCEFFNSVVEWNHCHDTAFESSLQGDGIEIKRGSYNNIVRWNVIHDTPYPGIFVYGYGDDRPWARPNQVYGNVVWNCASEAIQVTSDARIFNNIILNATHGIYSSANQGTPRNVHIYHNTVVNHRGACFRADSWDQGHDFIVANNVFYCPGGSAIKLTGDLARIRIVRNAVLGAIPSAVPASSTVAGRSLAVDLLDWARLNVYPSASAPFLRAADGNASASPAVDYNCMTRAAGPRDIGAYHWTQAANPGWIVCAALREEPRCLGASAPGVAPLVRPVPPQDPTPTPPPIPVPELAVPMPGCRAFRVDNTSTEGLLFDYMGQVRAGDVITVHAGVYTTKVPGHGSWYRDYRLHGNATHPIVVQAAPGERVVLEGDPGASQNIVNLGGEHFVWRGFEMTKGSIGLRLFTSRHAVFERLHIHHTYENAIGACTAGNEYFNLTFRANHIHHTRGHGECFYLGCHGGYCKFSHALVEWNLCHHTAYIHVSSSQGDGIEIKRGGHSSVVRYNVVHDTRYPGIFVYGYGALAPTGSPNQVYGNVVWNCAAEGIQVTSDARIHDNIVINAVHGIYSNANGGQPRNVHLYHNTIVNASKTCFKAHDWATGDGLLVANNAFYCPGAQAIDLAAVGTANFSANAVVGMVAASVPAGASIIGRSLNLDFAAPAARNMYPRPDAPFLRRANRNASYATSHDFNCVARAGAGEGRDVGAYHRTQATNPGWVPAPWTFNQNTRCAALNLPLPPYVPEPIPTPVPTPTPAPAPPVPLPTGLLRTFHTRPDSIGDDQLFERLGKLAPGDSLIVHAGTYTTQHRSTWYRMITLRGTAAHPIVVQAAPGEHVVLEGDPTASQNIVNLGGQHFVWRGFEMTQGSIGLRLHSVAHAVFEGLHIHHTYGVGIAANTNGEAYHNLTFRRNHIHHTRGHGECFYLGEHEGHSPLTHSLIEWNYCHHTAFMGGSSRQGDGIEIKKNGHSNVVRYNVIHDTPYPGIFVYGYSGQGTGRRPNEVYRNVVWNCGSEGIQVTSDARIHDNLVIGANHGIYSSPNTGTPTNIHIVHNTVVGAKVAAFRASGWGTGSDFVVANNVFYAKERTLPAMLISDANPRITYASNAVYGSVSSAVAEGTTIVGRGPVEDFLNAAALSVYPAHDAPFRSRGAAAHASPADYNCVPRNTAQGVDCGGYQWTQSTNPGWALHPGFSQQTQCLPPSLAPRPLPSLGLLAALACLL